MRTRRWPTRITIAPLTLEMPVPTSTWRHVASLPDDTLALILEANPHRINPIVSVEHTEQPPYLVEEENSHRFHTCDIVVLVTG